MNNLKHPLKIEVNRHYFGSNPPETAMDVQSGEYVSKEVAEGLLSDLKFIVSDIDKGELPSEAFLQHIKTICESAIKKATE